MHTLSPETDNCPSWISGRERMTVENISWSISTKECCRPLWGSNGQIDKVMVFSIHLNPFHLLYRWIPKGYCHHKSHPLNIQVHREKEEMNIRRYIHRTISNLFIRSDRNRNGFKPGYMLNFSLRIRLSFHQTLTIWCHKRVSMDIIIQTETFESDAFL